MSEAPINDLQPIIDEKVTALNDRLRLIEDQQTAELARFPAAPAVPAPVHVRRNEDEDEAPKPRAKK